jgi:hypothetical protein
VLGRIDRHRLLIAVACALGAGTVPVFAAPIGVTSVSLTAFRACVVTAASSSTTVEIDAFVQLDKLTQNNGTPTTMNVQSRSGQDRRTYVRLDVASCVPAIPASATIRSALLRFYITARPAACRTQEAYRVTGTWTETGVTWSNQPATAASPTASMQTGPSPCANSTTNQYVSGWDVTTDVAAFVAGSATNNGWMIRDSAEASGTTYSSTYRTNEQNNADKGPQLIIDYSI